MERRTFLGSGAAALAVACAGCVAGAGRPDGVEWRRAVDGHTVRRMLPTGDGGFVAVGETRDAVLVVKADAEGRPEWRRTYDVGETGVDVAESPDGGFAVLAATTPYLTSPHLLKVTADGDREWVRVLRERSFYVGGLAATTDGYLVVGAIHERLGRDESGRLDTRRSPRAVQVDAAGDVVWEATYPAPDVVMSRDGERVEWGSEYEDVHDVARIPGGYILIGTRSESDRGFALRIDDDGTLAWRRSYRSVSLRRVVAVPAGVVCLAEAGWPGPPSLTVPSLLALDPNGTLLWQYAYRVGDRTAASEGPAGVYGNYSPLPAGTYPTDLALARDGTFVVGGFTHSHTTLGKYRMVVLRVAADGKTATANTYDRGEARAVAETGDGDLVLAGEATGLLGSRFGGRATLYRLRRPPASRSAVPVRVAAVATATG